MRYSFTYGGVRYQLPEAEYHDLLRGLAAKLQDNLYPRAEDRMELARFGYNERVKLFNSQRVVGWILETWSGAELPDKEYEVARKLLAEAHQSIALARSQSPPDGDAVLRATSSLRRFEQQVAHVERLLWKYTDKIIGSGEDWVTGLQVVSTASFTIASVAGGAVLMAPTLVGGAGFGMFAAGAISGSGTSLLAAASDTVGRGLTGEKLDWGKELTTWGKSSVIGAVAGGAGGAIVGKLSGPLSGRLAARLANQYPNMPKEVLQTHLKNAIEGSLGNTVQGAIIDTAQAMQGNMTGDKFVENIVVNLLAGGFAGRFQAKVAVDRKGFHQVGTKGAGW